MAAGRTSTRTRWQKLAARYGALQLRERRLVAGALLFVIVFGGYLFWIEPALRQRASLDKALAQQQDEQAQLAGQLAALEARSGDPDAPQRAVLTQLQADLDAAVRDIRDFDRLLVTPAQVPGLLQTLLARHRGLVLVSLTTLPPQPLVTPPAAKEEGKAPSAAPGAGIYKHGIEIRIAGSYHDLLAYVGELERGPQKLLHGPLRLAVQKYPVSELTLTVYTLSLEATWLVV